MVSGQTSTSGPSSIGGSVVVVAIVDDDVDEDEEGSAEALADGAEGAGVASSEPPEHPTNQGAEITPTMPITPARTRITAGFYGTR